MISSAPCTCRISRSNRKSPHTEITRILPGPGERYPFTATLVVKLRALPTTDGCLLVQSVRYRPRLPNSLRRLLDLTPLYHPRSRLSRGGTSTNTAANGSVHPRFIHQTSNDFTNTFQSPTVWAHIRISGDIPVIQVLDVLPDSLENRRIIRTAIDRAFTNLSR